MENEGLVALGKKWSKTWDRKQKTKYNYIMRYKQLLMHKDN